MLEMKHNMQHNNTSDQSINSNMDQQGKYSKIDISIFPPDDSPALNCDSNSWLGPAIDFNESRFRTQTRNKWNPGAALSEEELKIRGELEMDIERDLEEEIKDGIYHLALRLHRFYQHQNKRNAREVSKSSSKNIQLGVKNNTLSEVNINIKMEGGTKIEIKETKKEGPERGRPRTSRLENVQGVLVPNTKKFDWIKSLRSGTGPAPINKKNESLHQARMLNKDRSLYLNLKLDNRRRNCTSGSGSDSGHVKKNLRVNNELLELGWKC